MNVLVIPEDAKYDRHMLQPILERMITSWLEIPATVDVMDQLKLGSLSQATARDQLRHVVNQYRMVDLFILCLDQNDRSDDAVADHIEDVEDEMRQHLDERNRPADAFFAVVARREIEAWVLVGCEESGNWTYTEVRQEPQSRNATSSGTPSCEAWRKDSSEGANRWARRPHATTEPSGNTVRS